MEKTKKLATQFIHVAPLMIRTVKAEIRFAADGRITHAQYRILSNISRGNTTVGQIAYEQGVSQPSMSKMVDSLVKKAIIQRTTSLTDRRQISLKMTAKGLKLFLQLKDKAAENFAIKLKGLSKAEQKDLKQSLEHMESLLQKIHKGKV